MTEREVVCLDIESLTWEQALQIKRMHRKLWPPRDEPVTEELVRRQAREMLDKWAAYEGPPEQRPRAYCVLEDDTVIACAVVEPHTVVTARGPLTVHGLAGVYSAPERRGEGLGKLVVLASLEPVDAGDFPCSLFQTSFKVLPFYEKLGARRVRNRFVNSKAEDPEADPFGDDVRVVYPATYDWPEGTVDTQSEGW